MECLGGPEVWAVGHLAEFKSATGPLMFVVQISVPALQICLEDSSKFINLTLHFLSNSFTENRTSGINKTSDCLQMESFVL